MPTAEQKRQARRHNINQALRAVVVFGMSVWTPYSLVGIYAPASWPQPAREVVTLLGMVFLAGWLTLGFSWLKRPDRWEGES